MTTGFARSNAPSRNDNLIIGDLVEKNILMIRKERKPAKNEAKQRDTE